MSRPSPQLLLYLVEGALCRSNPFMQQAQCPATPRLRPPYQAAVAMPKRDRPVSRHRCRLMLHGSLPQRVRRWPRPRRVITCQDGPILDHNLLTVQRHQSLSFRLPILQRLVHAGPAASKVARTTILCKRLRCYRCQNRIGQLEQRISRRVEQCIRRLTKLDESFKALSGMWVMFARHTPLCHRAVCANKPLL